MAKVSMNMPLTNSLGDYSIYPMKGVKKLIIRAKGGPSKEQIAKSPQFERLRKSQSEFAGAGKASGLIMHTTKGINHLADHTFSGMLTKVCRLIQAKETQVATGKRPILFSKYGQLLEGTDFNSQKTIDTVLKHLPGLTISRNEYKAMVSFTELYPGINLFNPWNYPMYRFIIMFGVLQDMGLTPSGYAITNPSIIPNRVHVVSDWHYSNQALPAATFELVLASNTFLDTGSSLVLSVGVEFGQKISNSITKEVAKAGCGKIIAVG